MKRKAFIIHCGNIDNSPPIDGPLLDAQLFKKYLMSSVGGSWKDQSEIQLVSNPTIKDFNLRYLEITKRLDYVLTIFSGHGEIDSLDNQYLCFKDGNIKLTDLYSSSLKETIIIDACSQYRSMVREQKEAEVILEQKLFSEIDTSDFYNSIISNCPISTMILHSSSHGEYSMGATTGGEYTYSLIKSAQEWSSNANGNSILNLSEANALSIPFLIDKFENHIQNPWVEGVFHANFPFAVGTKKIT